MPMPDFTVPGDDLLILAAKRADLPDLPVDDDERAAALLDLLTVADEIRAELSVCEAGWIEGLAELDVDAKRCRTCTEWFALNATGRHRLYCSQECKDAARRAA